MENGYWAMYGARLGTYMIMLEKWDHHYVQDFDMLERLWQSFQNDEPEHCTSVSDILRKRLGLPIVDMSTEESRFFKQHYRSNWVNRGPMIREIDVIRQQEGW